VISIPEEYSKCAKIIYPCSRSRHSNKMNANSDVDDTLTSTLLITSTKIYSPKAINKTLVDKESCKSQNCVGPHN